MKPPFEKYGFLPFLQSYPIQNFRTKSPQINRDILLIPIVKKTPLVLELQTVLVLETRPVGYMPTRRP